MSMYAQLLTSALAQRPLNADGGNGVTWPDIVQLRAELAADMADPAQAGWDPVAVATEIAYDTALIEFASRAGIPCRPSDFDRPYEGRSTLESALRAQGLAFNSIG
jgi:hypothetical protein